MRSRQGPGDAQRDVLVAGARRGRDVRVLRGAGRVRGRRGARGHDRRRRPRACSGSPTPCGPPATTTGATRPRSAPASAAASSIASMLDAELQRILDAIAATARHRRRGAGRAGARRPHRGDRAARGGGARGRARPTTRPPAASPCASTSPSGASGTVAYLHGGGWVMGNLDSVDAVCRALAERARARASSASTTGSRPSTRSRRRWRTRSPPTRPLDADLVVAGDSAGGEPRRGRRPRLRDQIKLQLLVYPVTDAGVNTPSYAEFGEGYGLTAAAMRRFWRLYLDGADGLRPRRLAAARRRTSRASRPPTS